MSANPSAAAATDRALADAVLAGDREAYRTLVERESRSVIALCTAILGDPDDAQDVAQDAFVHAYRSLASYRGDGTFGAWLGRIASRMAVARAAASGRTRAHADEPDMDGGPHDELANPERQLVLSEHARAIRQAINELPADQREVVSLRFFQDMSLDEIAAATGTPLGTVKSRLHRALHRLRRHGDLRSVS